MHAEHPLTESARAAIQRTDAAIGRLVKRYPEVFCSLPAVPDPPAVRESDIATEHWWTVARVQRFLRLAWDACELREREWHIFAARHEFHSNTVYMPVAMERLRKRVEANEPARRVYDARRRCAAVERSRSHTIRTSDVPLAADRKANETLQQSRVSCAIFSGTQERPEVLLFEVLRSRATRTETRVVERKSGQGAIGAARANVCKLETGCCALSCFRRGDALLRR